MKSFFILQRFVNCLTLLLRSRRADYGLAPGKDHKQNTLANHSGCGRTNKQNDKPGKVSSTYTKARNAGREKNCNRSLEILTRRLLASHKPRDQNQLRNYWQSLYNFDRKQEMENIEISKSPIVWKTDCFELISHYVVSFSVLVCEGVRDTYCLERHLV